MLYDVRMVPGLGHSPGSSPPDDPSSPDPTKFPPPPPSPAACECANCEDPPTRRMLFASESGNFFGYEFYCDVHATVAADGFEVTLDEALAVGQDEVA